MKQASDGPGDLAPRLACRVGVIGARQIAPDRIAAVVEAASVFFSLVAREVAAVGHEPGLARIYQAADQPILRVISSLADGADRIGASAGLAHGFKLDVVLPFDRADYERTFVGEGEAKAASIAEFADLLAKAESRVLTLDGTAASSEDRHRSYAAAGRAIVRNCDLLIAVWDGSDEMAGRGGTSDAVHYALRNGVPLWWINSDGSGAPRLIHDEQTLLTAPTAEADQAALLTAHLRAILLPPAPEPEDFDGFFGAGIERVRDWLEVPADPLVAYLAERGQPNRNYWNFHPTVIALLRRHGGRRTQHLRRQRPGSGTPDVPPPPAPPSHWPRPWRMFLRNAPSPSSSPTAALARNYRDRYRSSYLFIYASSAIAVIASIVGTTLHDHGIATLIEVAMLLSVLIAVAANEVFGWHARYVSYRMLGEMKRVAAWPHQLGWPMADTRARKLSKIDEHWVVWIFDAEVRAAPLITGTLDHARVATIRDGACDSWIQEQLVYHAARCDEYKGAAGNFSRVGRLLFLATLALLIVRTGLHFVFEVPEIGWMVLLCAILPVFAAAIFGFRAYEEFEVQALQSERMIDALRALQIQLRQTPIDRPLASELVARELQQIASLMLTDLAGWVQLFRMKAVEAG